MYYIGQKLEASFVTYSPKYSSEYSLSLCYLLCTKFYRNIYVYKVKEKVNGQRDPKNTEEYMANVHL